MFFLSLEMRLPSDHIGISDILFTVLVYDYFLQNNIATSFAIRVIVWVIQTNAVGCYHQINKKIALCFDSLPLVMSGNDYALQNAFLFSVLVTRIATFKELDSDFEKHTSLLTLVSSNF